MRTRIQDMRTLLANRLRQVTGGDSFDFIRAQHGMFSLLGVPPDAVERLREKHHIYMTADSRMNLAGIMPDNVSYVAEAFAAESAAVETSLLIGREIERRAWKAVMQARSNSRCRCLSA